MEPASNVVAPPLTWQRTVAVLARMGGLGETVVLVGGQAVNFWATRYERGDSVLAAGGPYTSRDVDFCGSPDAARECAVRLNGEAKVATFDDMNTPNTGVVTFIDVDGWPRRIDFLSAPAGVDATELLEQCIVATVTSDDGVEVSFRVMHPLHCLRSRAYNVAYLPGYDTEHARRQLRAAIMCARQYVLELAESAELVRARNANEEIFKIARWKAGPRVFVRHHIEIFSAAVPHPALHPRFLHERYPRMVAEIARVYAHALDVAERRADPR